MRGRQISEKSNEVESTSASSGRRREPEAPDVAGRELDPVARAVQASPPSAVAQASALNRSTGGRPSLGAGAILQMQRHYGNRHVQRVLALAREDTDNPVVTPEVESSINRQRGGGRGLDSGVRAQMEPAFRADFTGVRVHTDSQADSLNQALSARAFTTGRDIFFRQGEYNPGSSQGRELLAHELTHVVQQGGGPVQGKLTVSQPGDALEREADDVAQAVMQRVQRQPEEEEEIPEDAQSQVEADVEDTQEDEMQAKLLRQPMDEEEELMQAKVLRQPASGTVVQRVGPAAAVMGAAEWIALGSAGFQVAQSAVQSTAGDISYSFDEMEGVLLPAGGNDVAAYRAAHPSANIRSHTHTVSTWLNHFSGGRAMGIKFGITYNYDGYAIGNISCSILDTYDWPAWEGSVNVNFTPLSFARGGVSVIRITLNLNADRTLLGGMVRSRILELDGTSLIRSLGSGAHVRFGE